MAEEDDDLESLELEPVEGDDAPLFQDGEIVAGRFRIARFLARGSMGELFEAEDLELAERVALKTILPAIADDERLHQLFKREVHLARQVTHPNICRIYDVFRHRPPAAQEGASAREVVFLAMELLQGETLARRLQGGRLSTVEALPLARQMASGLSAAHRVGVVHRDFKSQNVMLVPARPPDTQPRVVITDFGLARRYDDRDRDASSALSQPGTMSGTPAYMAPEQVLASPISPATDVYALGVVLYEMVTGTWPFHGRTPVEVAVKRLQEAPPPPRVHVPDLDPRWEAVILRCLERDAADRFASAEEVVTALEAEGPRAAHGRRRGRAGRLALVGAAGVAVALGTFAWRLRPRAPHAEPGATETVVLADFTNSTGDAALDDALEQGLAAGLQHSPVFGVLPEGAVRDTLKLMGRAPGERVSAEVAQELCQRTASRAVIAGSISMLGTQYVVGLGATDCQTGDALARETARAAKKEDVLTALNQAVATVRQKVGDAVHAMPRTDTSIAQATTSSLDALKSYSMGVRANGEKGALAAVPLYERAIELDPEFAMAYASLGNAYVDLREHDRAARSFQKAYDLRGRVSDRERYALDAYYFANVTGELDRARQTHELWAQAFPRHSTPHTNLGVLYAAQGRHEQALQETLESLRLFPDSGAAAAFLVANYVRLDRLDAARAAYASALPRQADRPGLHLVRYGIAFLESDRPEMERQVAWGAGRAGAEDLLLSYQSDTEASSGHLERARQLSRRAELAARLAGKPEAAAQERLAAALREAEFGNPALARAEAAAALAIASTTMVRAPAALALARAGDADAAGRMADELEQQNPRHARINRYWLPTIRAAVAVARQDPSRAIELLETARPFELGTSDPQAEVGAMHPVYVRGLAYLALKQGTAAAAEFQKFQDHRGVALNSPLALLARLGLGRALALQGDLAGAREAYARFFALCPDADPDVPLLQQARAEQARLPRN